MPTDADRPFPEAAGHACNQVWGCDPAVPIERGSGINGQSVFVHGPAEVVIAKLSTWPVAWDDRIAERTPSGFLALAQEVARG
ncbi:MAG TPA: hypothetical protein VE011_06470 [Candidatus Dormibacteraeota bacterium]|nr:hypothetical protein [Candidatus Dormibacteraeota bacterium]